MINTALIAALVGGLAALTYAIRKSIWIHRLPVGLEALERIAGYIADGSQAFLKREYTVLVPFVLVVATFLAVANTGALRLQSASFLLGALCSAAAGQPEFGPLFGDGAADPGFGGLRNVDVQGLGFDDQRFAQRDVGCLAGRRLQCW